MYRHIGGSGTWGCEFPEDLNMEGITLLKRDMEFGNPVWSHRLHETVRNGCLHHGRSQNRQVLYALPRLEGTLTFTMTLPASAFSGH